MKRFLVALGLVAAGVVPAAAADNFYSQTSVYNWSGFWIGPHIGHVSGSVTGTSGFGTNGPDGLDMGIHAYYNVQTPSNWVYGLYAGIPIPQAEGTSIGGTIGVDWAMTGGVRVGYAFDRWLPYGLLAVTVGGATASGGGSNTHYGYAIGAGFDYAVTDNFAVGARYAHVSMSQENYSGVGTFGWDGDSIVATASWRLH